MMAWLRDASPRELFALLTAALIVILAAFLLFAPPDGTERAQLMQFVGRFHPLSVHLPVALLILLPFLELAGRTRRFPFLQPASEFLLGVAICGAIAAAALGWCLARGGGYSGALVTQHMWAALGVATAAWACWALRNLKESPGKPRLYLAALIATAGLVSFTGYRGGQLSQGENHLTEFMPAPLAAIFGTGADDIPNSGNGGPGTFYGARIQPVLASRCVTCHGRSRHKGKLRLDSFDALMRGGKHGAVIKPGDPKGSDLLRRVALPRSDEDAMPPDNRQPLSAGEIRLIEQWVSAGAPPNAPTDAIKEVAPTAAAPAAEVVFPEIDSAAVAKQRADLASAVTQLRQRLPNVVDYQARDSAGLVVNAAWMGHKFGDNELAVLAPVAERIVMADFSNTAITDKSAATIAAMKHLHSLRLMNTTITDATVQRLGGMSELETLSLFNTPITAACLPALSPLPKLQRVYIGGTRLSAATPIPQDLQPKLIF